ncbi:MAG: hypothetical protein AAF488_19945, partial [Planctomycetota bacterium]
MKVGIEGVKGHFDVDYDTPRREAEITITLNNPVEEQNFSCEISLRTRADASESGPVESFEVSIVGEAVLPDPPDRDLVSDLATLPPLPADQDLRVLLVWESDADLDLAVMAPNECSRFSFGDPSDCEYSSGRNLIGDLKCRGDLSSRAEGFSWPRGSIEPGTGAASVAFVSSCDGESVPFRLVVQRQGEADLVVRGRFDASGDLTSGSRTIGFEVGPGLLQALCGFDFGVSLNWSAEIAADLDLQVIDPNGVVVDRFSSTGLGEAPRDQVSQGFFLGDEDCSTTTGTEVALWSLGRYGEGEYRVRVRFSESCANASDIDFTVNWLDVPTRSIRQISPDLATFSSDQLLLEQEYTLTIRAPAEGSRGVNESESNDSTDEASPLALGSFVCGRVASFDAGTRVTFDDRNEAHIFQDWYRVFVPNETAVDVWLEFR